MTESMDGSHTNESDCQKNYGLTWKPLCTSNQHWIIEDGNGLFGKTSECTKEF